MEFARLRAGAERPGAQRRERGGMSDTNPLDFTGKVVIVTGGGRGGGKGPTERSLAAGAEVVICCRHEPETLPSAGARQAVFVAADIRDYEQIENVVRF